eukprot:7931898-Pyramimonas_sp.AAC.2
MYDTYNTSYNNTRVPFPPNSVLADLGWFVTFVCLSVSAFEDEDAVAGAVAAAGEGGEGEQGDATDVAAVTIAPTAATAAPTVSVPDGPRSAIFATQLAVVFWPGSLPLMGLQNVSSVVQAISQQVQYSTVQYCASDDQRRHHRAPTLNY